jgi:transglutaminase-like putative cysteine protease
LFLALAVLLSMSGALYSAGWSEGLDLVQAAVVAGALVGLLLALTRWEGLFAAFYSFLVSIVVVVTLLSRGFFPDLGMHDAIVSIALRNVAWLTALLNRAPAADNLIFVIQLCLLGWWLSFFAIWSLYRHQHVLQAVIPAGIGLLVVIYYSPLALSGYLVVYLVSVVLLAISVELARNETRWRIFHIRYAPDIYWDFLKAGLVFAVAVTALAWVAPSDMGRATMERILRPIDPQWRQFEETWSRMYQSLRYQGPAIRTTKFGKSMGLGGQVNLTDRPIFEADIGRRVYWRGASFDMYTGRGWQNTDDELVIIERNEALGEPPITMYGEITATIRPLETEQDAIFGAPQPIRVSVPTNADASRITKEGDLSISMLRSRVPFNRGSSYQVVSGMSAAPLAELQAAGTVYPEWVRDRFLQLPDEFPTSVRNLAQSVTANHDTPLDKAIAVENFLRGYKYNQQIDAPPPDVDAVEYFLLTSKEGYCDYYASAMVTMLRSVGVPARFVVGYTPGDYIQPPEELMHMTTGIGTYRVLERNAHAWPEVYFPQYGWIQFEPTASEPLLTRPVEQTFTPTPTAPLGGDNGNPNDNEDLLPDRGDQGPSGPVTLDPPAIRWLRSNWPMLPLTTGLLALIVGALLLLRRRRQAFFQSPELLARLFDVLSHWAARLRVSWLPSQTPLERAAAFNETVPEAGPAVDRLANLFVAKYYGRATPSSEDMSGLVKDWGRLEPSLWRRWGVQSARMDRLRKALRRPKPGNDPRRIRPTGL